MKYLITLSIILFSFAFCNAQNAKTTIAPELGIAVFELGSVQQFDDIVINSLSKRLVDEPRITFGTSLETSLFGALSLQAKLNYRILRIGSSVIDLNPLQSQFNDLTKVNVFVVHTINLEVLPTIQLLKINNSRIRLFGGPALSLNLTSATDIEFDDRVRDELEDTFNSLDDTILPSSLAFAYGVSVNINRFDIQVKHQMSSRYTNTLTVGDRKDSYVNNWEFLGVSVAYKLAIFKGKEGS